MFKLIFLPFEVIHRRTCSLSLVLELGVDQDAGIMPEL